MHKHRSPEAEIMPLNVVKLTDRGSSLAQNGEFYPGDLGKITGANACQAKLKTANRR
jgi:hypothetical protein